VKRNAHAGTTIVRRSKNDLVPGSRVLVSPDYANARHHSQLPCVYRYATTKMDIAIMRARVIKPGSENAFGRTTVFVVGSERLTND
jgi:hypothetical protein